MDVLLDAAAMGNYVEREGTPIPTLLVRPIGTMDEEGDSLQLLDRFGLCVNIEVL